MEFRNFGGGISCEIFRVGMHWDSKDTCEMELETNDGDKGSCRVYSISRQSVSVVETNQDVRLNRLVFG
jgi:hypothetical protein